MLISVLRCLIMYIAVVAAVRIMGKRQIGELQPSELVITILISELASLPLQDLNMPLIWGIVPMFLMVILELLMSLISLKSMKFRAFFYGRSILLIKHGKIDQNALLKTRVTVEDIMEAMRGVGVLSLEEVDMAVLETNGTISVIPKGSFAPPNRKEMKIPETPSGGIPVILIMNGRLSDENIKMAGFNREEVKKLISGINLKDVFMLAIDDAGKTVLIKKDDEKKSA